MNNRLLTSVIIILIVIFIGNRSTLIVDEGYLGMKADETMYMAGYHLRNPFGEKVTMYKRVFEPAPEGTGPNDYVTTWREVN